MKNNGYINMIKAVFNTRFLTINICRFNTSDEKNINSYQKEPRTKLNLAVLSENSNLANEYIPIGINNETKQKNIFIMFTYITG